MSWFSAALGGRFTGSGSIGGAFGINDNSAADVAAANAIRQAAQGNTKGAGQTVVQGAVQQASPGAVILTRNMQLAIGAGIVGYFLWKRAR